MDFAYFFKLNAATGDTALPQQNSVLKPITQCTHVTGQKIPNEFECEVIERYIWGLTRVSFACVQLAVLGVSICFQHAARHAMTNTMCTPR